MQIIALYIIIIICFALFKKVDAYEAFREGVEAGFQTVKNLFPSLMAIVFAVGILTSSGVIELLEKHLETNLVHPKILLQMILKPISWSSSLLVMTDIFTRYGADSKLGILSTLIQGSCDTTIYVTTVLFSSVKIKHSSYPLIIGLIANFLTFLFILLIYQKIF